MIIIRLIVGAIIGSIAGKLMDNGHKGFWKNAFLGILGGFVGGWAGSVLHVTEGKFAEFILSVAGACVVIGIGRLLKGKSK